MRHVPVAIALVAGLSVTACIPLTDPDEKLPLELDAAKVSQAVNARVGEHVDGVVTVMKSLERSERLTKLSSDSGSVDCPEPQPGMPPPACDVPPEPNPFDFTEEAEDVKEWLNENIFTASAVESSTATSVTYRLSTDVGCPENEDEEGVATRDEDCVKVLTELPVRFVVTSTHEGDLDIELRVGSRSPGSLELYAGHVSVAADLGAIKATLEDIAALLDEEIESFPDRFAGKVELKLTRHGSDDYSAAVSILEALSLGLHDATHLEFLDVVLAASTDVVKVRIDATAGTGTASVNFADIDLAAALDLVLGETESTDCVWNEETQQDDCTTTTPEPKAGVLSAALAGLTGSGTFGFDDDVLDLKGLGVGEEKVTIKLDGAQILGLTVNPTAGGVFDLLAASLDDGGRITVSPSLDVTVEHDLTALVAALDDEDSDIPGWLLGGSSSVKTTGPQTVVRVTEAEDAGECIDEVCPEPESAKVQVEEGKVTLSATGITDVVVEAPECLVEAEQAEGEESGEDAHLFTLLAAGACE